MGKQPNKRAVFSDPTKHRLVAVRIFGYSLVTLATIVAVSFMLSLLLLRSLPETLLNDAESFQAPTLEDYADIAANISTADIGQTPIAGMLSAQLIPYSRPAFEKTYAFVPDWPLQPFASLQENLDAIDVILPDWYRLDFHTGEIGVRYPHRQSIVHSYIRENARSQTVLPIISGFNGVEESVVIAQILSRKLVPRFKQLVSDNGYDGLCFDLRWVTPASIPVVLDMLGEVKATLNQTCAIVELQATNWPLELLSDVTDTVIFIPFTEPNSNTSAGPLVPHDAFAEIAAIALTRVDPAKAVFALGNIGFNWTSGQSRPVRMHFSEVARLAGLHSADINFDSDSLNANIRYVDAQGARHLVWFADAVTNYNQITAISDQPVKGFAIWPIGGEDPRVWDLLNPIDSQLPIAELLRTVSVIDYVGYEGKGEFLTAFGEPRLGIRNLGVDPDSRLIVTQDYTQLPATYTVARWGAGERNQIALTFDDGPDREFTPQILDILQDKGVPAAFFMVGENAMALPELVRRTADEGHEIGVHTFLHPNINLISARRLSIEVSATQRLLASITGRSTILFRAPFGEDTEPQNAAQVEDLLQLSDEGYLSVGMQIDPKDWFNPGTDVIVERVMNTALTAEGNILLLHDAGNDRSQTVAALPIIIDQLRAEGFEFVSLGTLIRKDISELMPLADENYAAVDKVFFGATSVVQAALVIIFALALTLGIIRSVVVVVMALARHRRRNLFIPYDPVTLIVPAYNEELVVLRTIESALNSNYDKLQVIVVDDGSTDKTFELVDNAYGDDPRVTLITQENQGKAEALNHGYRIADTDVIVAVDADTLIHPDAVRLLVRHFQDPKIGAVAGNTKVGNRINLLTRLQAVEYITSQNLDRSAFELFNAILVVPGSIGAWRKSVVQGVGGYTLDTLAEDADLTVSIIRDGYRIIYEDGATALTEAPETLAQLARQRLRWTLGILQVTWKHKRALLEGRGIGLVAIPNVILFGTILPLIAPIADLVFFAAVYRLIRDYIHHPTMVPGLESPGIFLAYMAYLMSDVILSAFAFALEPKEDKRLLWLVIFQRFFYRQLLYIAVFRAVSRALTGRLSNWQKVVRFAHVKAPVGQRKRSTHRSVDLERVRPKT